MNESMKAVVVDDDKKIIIMVGETLAQLGFRVFSAEEGKKALELLNEVQPDLLVCDLLLPGIHGADLCRMVKEDPKLQHTKIIAISAVYREPNYRLTMDCRAEAFIEKPFSVDELERLVKKVTGV